MQIPLELGSVGYLQLVSKKDQEQGNIKILSLPSSEKKADFKNKGATTIIKKNVSTKIIIQRMLTRI